MITYSSTTLANVSDGASNLSPFFSHKLTDIYNVENNPNGYWMDNGTSYGWTKNSKFTFTQLEDGWLHVHIDNSSGTATIRNDCCVPKYNPSIKRATKYTFLAEFRNNQSTGAASGSDFYLVQQSGSVQFWGQNVTTAPLIHLEGIGTVTVPIFEVPLDGSYAFSRFTKFSESDGESSHWTTNDKMVTFVFRANAGAVLDYDVRLSVYEGEYWGNYIPYVISDITDVRKSAEEANEKIDNLEIGGRNLLLNTNNFNSHKCLGGETWIFNENEASYTATSKSWVWLDLTYNPDMPLTDISSQPNIDLMGNTDLTLSIEAKCEGECNGLLYFQPVIYGNNNNRKYYLITNPVPDCINSVELTEEWKKYSVTFPADYTNTKYWTLDSTQSSYPDTGFGARIYWYSTGTVHIKRPKLEKGNKATDWTPAPEDVEESIRSYAQSIQSQVDGMAEIHYGTVAPTLSNAPYTSWEDTTTRDMHVDDLYYNTSTGYCYRFTKSGSTYSWTRIKDSDITAAATAASDANTAAGNAQTTANNANTLAGQKRRIFVNQPTPPYEIGDLWVEGSNGDIKKCKTAKATGSYTASDWELASKYTDDTLANEANDKIDDLEIGGKNYLCKNPKAYTVSAYGAYDLYVTEPLEVGQTYTLQLWNVNVSHSAKTQEQLNVAVYYCGGSQTFGKWQGTEYFDNGHADHLVLTFTPNTTNINHSDVTNATKKFIRLYNSVPSVSGTMYMSVGGWKLEKGNRATDWTPAPEDTQADIDTALAQSVEYIIGTQTAATGNWTGASSSLTELKDGTQIRYWLPYAGSGNASLNLTLKDGTSTGAIPIYRQGGSYNTTSQVVVANRVTTHFPAGTSISMVYGVNRIVSAVSSGVTYTGTFTGWFADGAYDSGNTYNRTRMQNAITAATAITAGHIICGTNSGYKNIGANIAFDLSYPLLYASSAIAATKTGDNNYLQINGISASNNGTITSGAAKKELYLKGTVSGNIFTISASPFMTTVVPTSADGFYYIPLGMMYSATAIYFISSNRLYAYIDGAFQPVDTAAVLRAQDAKNLATAVYGTCSTTAETAAKIVACDNFILFNGARIQITFTYANTASIPTLNVNNTGAKSIYINKSVVSASNQLLWGAGSKMEFVYDGTGWILQNAPFSLYGTCNAASATVNKEVTCNEAVICKASIIYIKMTYSNTAASAKLNVASTGAKNIKANGADLTANSRFNWNAGATIAFTFDGQYWNMSDDTITAYVTDTSDDGIMVHPVNDQNTGWSIGNSIQLLKNSISYIKLWLENNIAKIRIGEENKGHIVIDNNSVDVMNNNTCLASFGATSTIGQTNGAHIEQNSSGLQVIDADGNNQVIFGAQSTVITWKNSITTIPPSTEENNIVQIELPIELASDQNMTLTIDTTVYTIPTRQTYSYTHTDYTISYDGTYTITITNLSTSILNSTLDYPIIQPLNYGITAITPNATRIKARAYANNTVIAEGGIYANDAGNFGLYDTKRTSWMMVSTADGTVKIPSLIPKLISTTKVIAPSTKGSWAYANILLKQWAVIAVRVSVHNVRQYILFFSPTSGSIQNIMDRPSSTLYIRGQFMAKWDTNRIYVNWVDGNTSVYQTVFFDQVIGLIRK